MSLIEHFGEMPVHAHRKILYVEKARKLIIILKKKNIKNKMITNVNSKKKYQPACKYLNQL